MGEELSPEISKKDMEIDNPEEKSHWYILEGKLDSKIEDPEKLEQPGRMVDSVPYGDRHFAKGILVRDKDGRIAIVVNAFRRIDGDTEMYHQDDYDDPSIRHPKVYTNPELDILYADNTLKRFKAKSQFPSPVYAETSKPIHGNEDFHEYSHLEVRGHDFRLGELVSFGNGIGRLALITHKDKSPKLGGTDILELEQKFGIVARKERGKGGETVLWMVDVEEVDYVVHDEKGAIKRYPDKTIFKPTLGNPKFDDPTG